MHQRCTFEITLPHSSYLAGPPASRVVLRPRRFIFSRVGTKDEALRTKITAVRWRYGRFKGSC